MNQQGRPTKPVEAVGWAARPSPGNRALRIEEALIFEIGRPEVTGVDLDEPARFTPRLGGLERKEPIGLPGLAEPEAVRHYVRLSRMNYSIDSGDVSARLLHHEAQSAPQREDGAAAGLRRHPSAAAGSRPCRARSS